ncbi:hypothetical protein ACFX2B_025122 [Malus domestica]
MWVQLHNVPSLNMTDAVASAIGGLIGSVLKVDKDDGRDRRFLHVKISFDVREPLMRGANVEFPVDGEMWVDFRYDGLPNYCLICGKMGHVTWWCKEEAIGERASVKDIEALYAFKGLDAEFNLRGNWLVGMGQHVIQRGVRRRSGLASNSSWRRQGDGVDYVQQDTHAKKAEERERQRVAWE